MWTRIAARGLWRSALRSKSANDMQRSSRLQSTNSTAAPAPIAASGVAMNVFEGQRTVSPRTPAYSSAARAPPAQLDIPTLGSSFQRAQRASKASSLEPSDHCSESSTSVQSSNSLPRSRWSNPIANFDASDRVVSGEPKSAARLAPGADSDPLSALLVRGLEHGPDRPRAGQEHGAGDGHRHAGDEHRAVEGGRLPRLVEDQRCKDDRDQDLD